MKARKRMIGGLISLILLSACVNVDCPLNNAVLSHWSFYTAEGQVAIGDSLYVYAKANGKDTLLINRLYNASSMDLPMSYYNQRDTFLLEIHSQIESNSVEIWQDLIIVTKDNIEHFNSPECGVWHEHTVNTVSHTQNTIDSVQIVRQKIDTNESENFRIYFK